MSKFLYTQYNFSNGELNPRLLGRTDIKEYFQSGKRVEGMVVAEDGSLNEVAGYSALYYNLEEDGTPIDKTLAINAGRDIWKRFNDGEYTLLQIGDSRTATEYTDFILSPNSAVVSLNGFTNVDPFTRFEYGTHIVLNDVIVITDKNGIHEPIVVFGFSYIALGGTRYVRVESFTNYCRFINSNVFSSDEAGYFAQFLGDLNVNDYYPMTVASGVLTTDYEAFDAGMEGAYLEIYSGSTSYIYRIDTFNNAKSVDATNIGAAAPDGNYTQYRLPQWYSGNYPKVVSFFQERLLFANTRNKESTIWASQVGNLGVFNVKQDATPDNSSPFDFTPFSADASPILWLLTERYLTAGSKTEEFIITPVDGIFSSTNINITSTSKYGSHDVGLAFRAQSASYFVERGGKNIRELRYSEENGGYTSRNVGLLSPEMGEVLSLSYDYSRKRIFVNADDGIYCCTIDPSAQILGWVKLPYQGKVLGVTLEGLPLIEVEGRVIGELDIYTEADNYSGSSDTYPTRDPKGILIGEDKISFTESPWNATWESDYSDDGTIFTNEIVIPFYYMEDFAGSTLIGVRYDGTVSEYTIQDYVGAKTKGDKSIVNTGELANGNDDLLYLIAKPRSFDTVVETNPIQQGSQLGDAQISFQRVDKMGVRLHKSNGTIYIGTQEDYLDETPLGNNFTGVKTSHIGGCPEIDHTLFVKNTSSSPIVLLSILARGLGQEG